MQSAIRTVVCVIILAFLLTAQADAGWVIEQVTRSGGTAPPGNVGPDRQVVIMSANRMKTTSLDPSGKPTAAWIMDLEAQSLSRIDYQRQTVATGKVQDYADSMQAARTQMTAAMKQMQQVLKDIPPEQRQKMEQMMRQHLPSATPAGGTAEPCPEPKLEVRPTGQTAEIAGYPAARYDVLEDGKLRTELWLSKAITAWKEIDSEKLERFSQEITKASQRLPGCRFDWGKWAGLAPNDPVWKLANEGYPVRTVSHGPGEGSIHEVVTAESRTVPLTEFQAPPGFKQQSLKDVLRRGGS